MIETLETWKLKAKTGKAAPGVRLCKQILVPPPEDAGERSLRFVISTGARDRERDTLSVEGWDLSNYRKNPVVLWAHDYAGLPVARATHIAAENGKLVAVDKFTSEEENPFGAMVYRLYKGGFLSAVSVGFAPQEWTFNEEAKGVDFNSQELLEHSAVPVPANPEALIEARSAGIDLGPLTAWAEQVLDTLREEPGLWVPRSKVEQVFDIASGEVKRSFFYAKLDSHQEPPAGADPSTEEIEFDGAINTDKEVSSKPILNLEDSGEETIDIEPEELKAIIRDALRPAMTQLTGRIL